MGLLQKEMETLSLLILSRSILIQRKERKSYGVFHPVQFCNSYSFMFEMKKLSIAVIIESLSLLLIVACKKFQC